MKIDNTEEEKSLKKDTLRQGNTYEEDDDDDDYVKTYSNFSLGNIDKRFILLGVVILIIILVGAFIYKSVTKDSSKETKTSAENIVDSVENPQSGSNSDRVSIDPKTGKVVESGSAQIISTTKYDDDTKAKLRAAGYTADDIEKFEASQSNSEELLEKAKEDKTKYLMDLYTELNPKVTDATSEEFKNLKNMTWLSGTVRPVYKDSKVMYTTSETRENCRYVKIPPTGGQLFIKLTLKNGDNIFYNVHPQSYESLDQEGNMVIQYDTIKYGAYNYYLNIKEIPIAK